MDNALLSPKQQLVQEIKDRLESIQRRLDETETSIEQHELEVKRINQRNLNVSAQLQRVEDNFDSIPRSDIRVAYEDTLETQKRLVTFNIQLDGLRETYKHLEEQKRLLEFVLNMLGEVTLDQLGTGGDDLGGNGKRSGLANEQIVRIVEAQEAERKRLANALHDGPAQSLTNFILQAEICQRLFDRDPDSASHELVNLKTAASISFQKIRDFIFELRPMMLDDLGLIATMRRHIENYNEKLDNVDIEFSLTGAERRLPNHVEVMMFRGLQVLISNSLDILNATDISVRMDIDMGRVKGTVEDNGRHFDVDVVLDRSQGDDPLQNLLDLRERIEMIGGTLSIYSEEKQPNEDIRANSVEIAMPFTDNVT
ncbi:MAG: histidine kinase [Anaerolineales bacterium]